MTGTRFTLRTTLTSMLAATALLTAASCGGDDDSGLSSGGDTTSPEEKGTVSMSGQAFTEMQIMAELYKQVLENAGYTVDVNLVETRDLYIDGLGDGQIDVVPEYLAGIADQLNGDEAFTINDPEEALAELEPIAAEAGITMLEPSQATDQNAFFVTQEYAETNDVTTLSDVAAVGEPITLAAHADCKGRDDCEAGLTTVYGIDIARVLDTGFGSQQTKDSVLDDESQLGLTGTTDASLDALGLVLLEDDKGIQPAQNLIPAVNSDFLAENPDVEGVLNELSATLTTEDLAALNAQVDIERQKAADVAQAYLSDNDLI